MFILVWELSLKGENFVLTQLASCFQDSTMEVKEINGRFVLMSSEFEEANNFDDVKAKADQFITILNGLVKVMFGNKESIESGALCQLFDDGTRAVQLSVTAPINVKAFVGLSVVRVDGKEQPQFNYFQKWFELSKTNDLVHQVLLLMSFDYESWVGLYRIYEIIEKECLKKGWVNKATSNLFKHTANSYRAVGIHARHGLTNQEPPKNPMGLEEAQSIIGDLVKKWFMVKAAEK